MTSAVIDAGDNLPLTLPAIWRHHVERRPDAIMLAIDDDRLSYAEVDARSRVVARGLIAAGAAKGSHIGLLYPNSADFIVAMIAASRIGAVILPFSTLSTPDELRQLLTNSDTQFVLAAARFRSQHFAEMLQKAFPEFDLTKPAPIASRTAPWLRRIWFSGELPAGSDPYWSIDTLKVLGESVDPAVIDAVETRVSPADRAIIVHTSGSTSAPKGVIHAHGALIRHLDNINEIRDLGPEDIVFTTSPWFWVAGFIFALMGTIVAGGRIVYSSSTSASETLDLIEREKPTMCTGVYSTTLRLAADPSFAQRDFSSMVKGNLHPIMPPAVRASDPLLRHNIYGMSEVAGALTMCGDYSDQPEHRRGSNGSVLPGYEVKVVDPESFEERAPGEVGELWLRGAFFMEGYYGRPRSQYFEADGWWRSGDLVSIDADGFLYVTGRMGDMIKTMGANVAPREVEAVLTDITGAQTMVLGVPDPERGQAVAAFVIGDAAIDETAILRETTARLSRYKVPRRILPLRENEIPLLSSGKVNMPALTRLMQDRW